MSIWKNNVDLQQLNKGGENCMVGHLGIQLTGITDNSLTATMPVDKRTRQPYGLLHGGASAVLSETLGSIAAGLCVDFNENKVVGIEVSAKHVRGVNDGIVTGICKPVKIGRTLHVWQTEIFNEQKQLICTSQLMVMVVSNKRL